MALIIATRCRERAMSSLNWRECWATPCRRLTIVVYFPVPALTIGVDILHLDGRDLRPLPLI
jgi:hypothetical protein